MPVFKYKAIDLDSKKVTGTISAENGESLIQLLRAKSLMVTSYSPVEEEVRSVYKLKANEVAEFSQEIATMLSAGITIIHALDIILKRDSKEKLRNVYSCLYSDLSNGKTLSEAMEGQGEAFPTLFINMYKTGEESGRLDIVAAKMALHYTKEHRLNNKVKSATIYPKILLVLMTVVVIVIFTIILPSFFKLFENLELPLPTKIVVALSNGMVKYWLPLLILACLLALLFQYVTKKRNVRLKIDEMKLKLPKIGKLNKIIYTARFARTLSSLYSSGLSIVNALTICSRTIDNTFIEDQMPSAIEKVRSGESLSDAIQGIKGFDVKLGLSVFIGQESGQLDKMLDSVSDSFDYEAEVATEKLVALLEPVLIVFMAVVVGFIAVSVLLPILSLYQNVG